MTVRRGFTMIELLATISVLLVVMSLLAYPIFSAYGYIQKARARGDAQNAGDNALRQVTKELNNAGYIFEISPDGSMVTFIPGDASGQLLTADGKAMLVRYMQVPDMPFIPLQANGTPYPQGQLPPDPPAQWGLLAPNFLQAPSYAAMDGYQASPPLFCGFYADKSFGCYAPFSITARQSLAPPANPYILVRYQSGAMSWGDLQGNALYGIYPLVDYKKNPLMSLKDSGGNPLSIRHDLLQQQFRAQCIAVTPLGKQWDVPRFQVTPGAVSNEALAMPVNAYGQKDLTLALARYPLWVGHNTDVDLFAASSMLTTLYGAGATPATLNAQLAPTLYPIGVNPFGYTLKIFNSAGQLVYGSNGPSSFTANRHVMDWPPLLGDAGYAADTTNWDNNAWNQATIARQRREGKFVFSEPVTVSSLTIDNKALTNAPANVLASAILPPPGNWDALYNPAFIAANANDALTYLTSAPERITLNGTVYKRVLQASQLAPAVTSGTTKTGTFYLPNIGAFNSSSRVVWFGDTLAGGYTLTVPLSYRVCDVQPGDLVVANYSTNGVLDLAMTISRQDIVGHSPEQQRQDYVARAHVVAENAIKRARSSQ